MEKVILFHFKCPLGHCSIQANRFSALTIGKLLLFCATLFSLTACSADYIHVKSVVYQSLRTKDNVIDKDKIPKDARIIVMAQIGITGACDILVQNNTDKIMTIDRTKSFFCNKGAVASPYYNPNIEASSVSHTEGHTGGVTVNVGTVANAVGVGGTLGMALNGVNVTSNNYQSSTLSNTTYRIDQPKLQIPPHGISYMGRTFLIDGVGLSFLEQFDQKLSSDVNSVYSFDNSFCGANICISFSLDDEKTYETVISDLFCNALILSKVKNHGETNTSLRNVYKAKTDALSEPWFMIHFISNISNKSSIKTSNNTFTINYK